MEFDKIIKDKIENTDFEYNDSSWMKFNKLRRKKKILKISAIIGSVAVLISTVVAIFLFTNNNHSQIQNPNSSTEVSQNETVLMDSSEISETNLTTPINEQITKRDNANSFNTNSRKEEPQRDTSNNKSVQKPKTDETIKYYGRPLTIDVDTIKDNVPSDEELKKGNSRIF